MLHFIPPSALQPANGKSVPTITIQTGNASSTWTTHLFGSPTACSCAAKTKPFLMRTIVLQWKILVSNTILCISWCLWYIQRTRGILHCISSGLKGVKHVLAWRIPATCFQEMVFAAVCQISKCHMLVNITASVLMSHSIYLIRTLNDNDRCCVITCQCHVFADIASLENSCVQIECQAVVL